MDLCIFPKSASIIHSQSAISNGSRQLFLDMIRFQTAFRSTVALGHSGKAGKPSKSANSISFHNSIFHSIIPASHLFPHSSEPSLSSFQRAISVFPIPASHLCLHSSEPARYSNTVPFQYSIITSPFQQ